MPREKLKNCSRHILQGVLDPDPVIRLWGILPVPTLKKSPDLDPTKMCPDPDPKLQNILDCNHPSCLNLIFCT